MRRTQLIALAVGAVVALSAVGVGLALLANGHSVASPPHRLKPQPPSVSPSPVSDQLLSPFTGEPVKRLHRVLIVKIDNLVTARPATGLAKADIVYLLPVEGGLSRIFAVFSSKFPSVIGPIRSARADDIELLRQFGRPAFVWSGAQPQLVPVVEHSYIVDLYAGIVGGFYRDPFRLEPHNLYAHTKQLLAEAPHASKARDIGFRFGAAPAGGRPTRSFSVSYPAASFRFIWSHRRDRWLVWMDGARATYDTGRGQLGAATVVIQYTKVVTSRYLEYPGIRPPYAKSMGSGTAIVLRNGRAYRVHWSRPEADGGTTYTLPDGQRMLFQPGNVWVVLAVGRGSTSN
jgi:Protein of unknown function (DUF3048) N-terminal domain/Protein of unknown function (DUF3048) C-terminal domain